MKVLMTATVGFCCYWVVASTGNKQMAQMVLFVVGMTCLQFFLEWALPVLEGVAEFFKSVSDFLSVFSK